MQEILVCGMWKMFVFIFLPSAPPASREAAACSLAVSTLNEQDYIMCSKETCLAGCGLKHIEFSWQSADCQPTS